MASVDVFVFLDDVQFERRSWQTRNRILFEGVEKLLTVPVKKTLREELIKNIEVDYSTDWQTSHLGILKQAYRKAPCFGEVVELLKEIISIRDYKISDMNIKFISKCADLFEIKCSLLKASDLGCRGERADHLAALCKRVGAERYISPVGSMQYLEADDFQNKHNVCLGFSNFVPREYKQTGSAGFISHLSTIDVVANIGIDGTKKYIRNGTC
jgi:hypothetical protein